MAGITPRWGYGIQITRDAKAAIVGGQLLEATTATGGGVQPAGAGSLVVQGVALNDADPAPSTPAGTIVVNPVPPTVTVARSLIVPVTYAAAATFGAKLIAAAGGQVTPAGAAPDMRTVVGECQEPGGVALGGVGNTYIY
jgi:hypothetical protein